MPITRRVIGGALAGLGDTLSSYFAKQAEDALVRRRQAATQDAITAREQENKRADLVRQLTDKVAANPTQYDTLVAGAQLDPLLKGFDFSAIKPTPSTLLAPIETLLNSAKNPTDLPADIGSAMNARGVPATSGLPLANGASFGAQADYADATPQQNDLMNLAGRRLTQLADQQSADEASKVDQAGNIAQAEAYGQGIGKSAAATDTLDQDVANAVSKATTLAPVEARAVGQKAGAEESARLAVQYNPANIQSAAKRASEIAKAEALAKGDTTRLKYIETAKENAMQLGGQLERLMNLYGLAKKGDLKAASLYSDLSANLKPTIARASGYNGRLTNMEMSIAGGAIPGLKDALLGTSDQKFRFLRGLATYGPTVAAQLPPDASIDDYMSAVKRLVDQEPPPSGKPNITSVTPIRPPQ